MFYLWPTEVRVIDIAANENLGDSALKIALVQYNARLGDLNYNVNKIADFYNEALRNGADIVVFPELALCGYPPEDLLLKRHFLDENHIYLKKLAEKCTSKILVVGFAESYEENCYNSLAVINNGRIDYIYRKNNLPNYGVFDEKRYFTAGDNAGLISIDGFNIALTICEDIWDVDEMKKLFRNATKLDLIVNISASPFHKGKIQTRKEVLANCSTAFDCPSAYCNFIGGQDELVFDGRSIFTDQSGKVVSKAKAFEEDIIYAEIAKDANSKVTITPTQGRAPQPADIIEEVYHALVLGTRDYAKKNGFKKAIMGLSGGIDSALVAAIAVTALGKENIIGITMPSKFNTSETISDAEILASNLGIDFHTLPISDTLNCFHKTLGDIDGWDDTTTAYENLQARIRGTMLMSLSNQFGYLVITTGNKSETAVGYSTLYGDTAGGFAMIKDVPKTMVYKLCEYINSINTDPVIPVTTITRPPSAELRANQQDSDSLPDYDLLDTILEGYVELDQSAQQLVERSLPADQVNRIVRLVDRNEYKRRQSPPGLKISPKAFGRDRRLPITNSYLTQVNCDEHKDKSK